VIKKCDLLLEKKVEEGPIQTIKPELKTEEMSVKLV
jgi:hypothetical protein